MTDKQIEAAARAIEKLLEEVGESGLAPQDYARAAIEAYHAAAPSDHTNIKSWLRRHGACEAPIAADAIEALEAQVAELKAELKRHIGLHIDTINNRAALEKDDD